MPCRPLLFPKVTLFPKWGLDLTNFEKLLTNFKKLFGREKHLKSWSWVIAFKIYSRSPLFG
tara:strand:- start:1233 stop:1415 length:183 start_codon:yes stop_codon:yes gene_type:complete